MRPYLRRSIWTKFAALGFIAMILMGNIWLVYFLTGHKATVWFSQSLGFCMVWTALAGCGMGLKMALHRFEKEPDDNSSV